MFSFFFFFFFFNDPATTEIYTSLHTLSLHDLFRSLPDQLDGDAHPEPPARSARERPRSEEHTSELQSRNDISYAVFCLKKKKKTTRNTSITIYQNKKKTKK